MLVFFLGVINAILYGATMYFFQKIGVENQIKANIFPKLVKPETTTIWVNALLFKITLWGGLMTWFGEGVLSVVGGVVVCIAGIFLLAMALHDPVPENKRQALYFSGMYYPSGMGFLMILVFFVLVDLSLDRIFN